MTDTPAPPLQLFIAGDSTANNSTDGQTGWGEVIDRYLDTSRLTIHNRAIGARSTRTFRREGRWRQLLDDARPGDLVLIQFGHNDLHPLDDPRERGTISGIGDESQTMTLQDGTQETVYTYGHYLRRFVREAKAKGLVPVVLSWVPMCPAEGQSPTVPAEPTSYALWARQVAEQEGAAFCDIHHQVSVWHSKLGRDEIKQRYFSNADDVHTVTAGAELNAKAVAQCLAELPIFDASLVLDTTPQGGH